MSLLRTVILAMGLFQATWAKNRGQIDRKLLDKAHPTVDHSGVVPLLTVNGRVMDLAHGEHFDDIQQDTPDDVRPPGLIAFHGHNTCPDGLSELKYRTVAEQELPPRERLMIASYDVDAAPKRAWYKFTPERDLAKRFNVDLSVSCPTLVFVPRSCNGLTKWCRKGDVLGCDDFTEQCTNTVQWDGKGDWQAWVGKMIAKEGWPKLSVGFKNYHAQGRWIRARDQISTTNILRNMYLANALPGFTPNGAKVVPCPDELCDWLESHYERTRRTTEHWAASGTQNSFHVTKTQLINIDEDYQRKQDLANKFMKPMMEEWSGIPNLQLTSFYGIREYHEGHWLRNHVDREETHVISATISIAKFPEGTGLQNKSAPDSVDPWPLTGINWQGENVVYPHPPRSIILYESAKFVHGRYQTNPVGGGIHLGAFLHYAPPDGWGWEEIARQGTRKHENNQDVIGYTQTESVDPEEIVWSQNDYFELTDDDIDGVIGSEFEDNASKSVVFVNDGDRPLWLFWKGGDGMLVDQCGKVAVNGRCSINTFNGHAFRWAQDKAGQSSLVDYAISSDNTDGSTIQGLGLRTGVNHEEL